MCGRFNIEEDEFVNALIHELDIQCPPIPPCYNIAPTATVPVIVQEAGQRAVREMRWWLTPHWAHEMTTKFSMFNARCENLNASKAFKGSYRYRRGIIPASSFIEWKMESGIKQPYLIKPQGQALAFAVVWDLWEKQEYYLESCAIVTTQSHSTFTFLHQRFPVVLSVKECAHWLDETATLSSFECYFKPRVVYDYQVAPLSTDINNARVQNRQAVSATDKSVLISASESYDFCK